MFSLFSPSILLCLLKQSSARC
uniref:Uncharacterized protein n=1 Tax=Anguilla anguilla TaxID=7936 RepID=A0A0E9V2X2_ANGAN